MKLATLFILVLLPSLCWGQRYSTEDGENLPELELGGGLVAATVSHYPGSDSQRTLVLPVPTLIYRGDILRSDEDGGVRGRFFKSDRYELNLSIGGSLPVSGKDNDEREGMPTLNTMVEFGPGFIIHFIPKKKKSKYRIALNIPLRLVVSSNFKDTREQGIMFNPLLYGFYKLNKEFSLFLGVSGAWASQKFHKYIYDVEKAYVRENRPEYQSDSGFVVTTSSIGFAYNSKKYTAFVGYAHHDASSNANKKSPLFVKEENYSAAIGLIWWFYEKKEI